MVEEHLLNMLARLDYNSYYSRVFGRSEIEDLGEEEGASDEETGYGFHGPSAWAFLIIHKRLTLQVTHLIVLAYKCREFL